MSCQPSVWSSALRAVPSKANPALNATWHDSAFAVECLISKRCRPTAVKAHSARTRAAPVATSTVQLGARGEIGVNSWSLSDSSTLGSSLVERRRSDFGPVGSCRLYSLAEAMVRPSSPRGVGMAGGNVRLPPRWFVVTAWHVHRWMVRATGGRKGLWPPRSGKWGTLRLTTRGRRSGEPRSVIVGYYEEGPT
jgi:hypothetical protein